MSTAAVPAGSACSVFPGAPATATSRPGTSHRHPHAGEGPPPGPPDPGLSDGGPP